MKLIERRWASTALGRYFTRSRRWSVTIGNDEFIVEQESLTHRGSVLSLDDLTIERGLLWSTVLLPIGEGQTLALSGIPNGRAAELKEAASSAAAQARQQLRIAWFRRRFDDELGRVTTWVADNSRICAETIRTRGWLSRAFKEKVEGSKPKEFQEMLGEPEIAQLLATRPAEEQDAVAQWRRPFASTADALNRQHATHELLASKPFFDTVEKSPLTKEQAEAVICFDDRVLLVASAGSGKTSTMVAKVGYALLKGYFTPDQILVMAFNNDAAAELRERIKARLGRLDLHAEQVAARTFHAFGLDVIGKATGRRPSLASWVENGRDLETLLEMVDELKSIDPLFRVQWDLFRLVFGQDLPEFGAEATNPDAWDKKAGREGFRTLNNEVVRSRGELVIANWFFYNGVRYVYEKPYEVDTADAEHRQYQPDFYLPDVDAYLEHWALDAKGEPPAEFEGYKESMEWKRKLHADQGTRLLETTMSELWSGRAFEYLERELTKLGIQLDPNPDREVTGPPPLESPRLARTIRSFLTHTKSNRLGMSALRRRVAEGAAGEFRIRHEMFLGIFEKLWERWEERLRAEQAIDFEDMLNTAADCVEAGRWDSPYELVMVDEFQDASQARARLVAALLRKPGAQLFAVGDDWQSINRFAGADLSVMTDFEGYFGKAVTLKIETTFRCPQSLCDISSTFVRKNSRQLPKVVRSARPDVPNPVRIVAVPNDAAIRAAVESTVEAITGTGIGGNTRKRSTVYVLGRYRRDEVYMPRNYDANLINVEFITIHASKGLEADHVIIPRVTSETLGLPSRVVDDPVLAVAMPSGDAFEYAEERRLFYVALTRARRTATLVTISQKESPFVIELVRDHGLKIRDMRGDVSSAETCPECSAGLLVRRTGRYGPFLGCANFPRCRYTVTLPAGLEATPARRQS